MATAAGAILLQQATKSILGCFDQVNADSPDRAIAFVPANRDQRYLLRGLVCRGVIVTTAAGDQWLDRDALAASKRRDNRQTAALLIAGVAATVALAIAFG